MTQLVWFRNDLRVADNSALTAACESSRRSASLFVITPDQWQEHDWSTAVQFIIACQRPGRRTGPAQHSPILYYADRFDDSIGKLRAIVLAQGYSTALQRGVRRQRAQTR